MFVLDGGRRIVVPRTEMTYPGIDRRVQTEPTADPTRMSRNAATAPVDHVMADMEDACPFDLKGEPVRKAIADAFTQLDFGNKVITFRPNNVKSGFFEGDVDYVMRHAKDKFHGIILPKPFSADDVAYAVSVLRFCHRLYAWETPIHIEVLIETPSALTHLEKIAEALVQTGSKGVYGAGLIFGIADFASFMNVADIVTGQSRNFAYAKQKTATVAKAYGLHAIDNVYLQLWRNTDEEDRVAAIQAALRQKNLESASFGMDGSWIVHPQQADIVNSSYGPSAEQIEAFRTIVELWEKNGGGSMVDPKTNEMVDDATIRIALQGLNTGVQAGHIEADVVARLNQRITQITGYDVIGLGLRG